MKLCLLVLVLISVAFAISQNSSPNRKASSNVDSGSTRRKRSWVDPRVLNTVINQGVSAETVNVLNTILNSGLVDANLMSSYYYPLSVAYDGTAAGETFKYLFNFFANGAYNNYLKHIGVSPQNTLANQPSFGNSGINPFAANPASVNPFAANPLAVNPFTANPFTANAFTANPMAVNPRFVPGPAAFNSQFSNLNNNPFTANAVTLNNNPFSTINNNPFATNNVNPFAAVNNNPFATNNVNLFTALNNNPFSLNNQFSGFQIPAVNNNPFAANNPFSTVNNNPFATNNVNPFTALNNNPFSLNNQFSGFQIPAVNNNPFAANNPFTLNNHFSGFPFNHLAFQNNPIFQNALPNPISSFTTFQTFNPAGSFPSFSPVASSQFSFDPFTQSFVPVAFNMVPTPPTVQPFTNTQSFVPDPSSSSGAQPLLWLH